MLGLEVIQKCEGNGGSVAGIKGGGTTQSRGERERERERGKKKRKRKRETGTVSSCGTVGGCITMGVTCAPQQSPP